MALIERQEKIIGIMKVLNNWITGKELSQLLTVSDRTIRSDIDAINSTYEVELIESNSRLGYHLNRSMYHTLNMKIEETVPQTPQERCIYIIQELLFQKQGIELLDLQNRIYISGYSIDNDIKRIKIELEPYEKLKLVRSKNLIHLEGNESSKRKLYKDLLSMETRGNFLNINKLASFYKEFDLLVVKQILDETLEEYDFHIREMASPLLMIHISVAMERILHHNYIESECKRPELMKNVEYKIAQTFYQKVANIIKIQVVEDEIVLLSLLLLGKRSSEYTGNEIHIDNKKYDAKKLIDGLLEDIYNAFDIDFREDVDLKIGLQMHVHSMMERQVKRIKVDNVYLNEIKRKYPMIFEMGVRAGKYIEEIIQQPIDENEIGFIALHFGSAYDRSEASSKYRVLIIFPDDQAVSERFLQKVEAKFQEQLKIIGCISLFEEQQVLDMQPDLILTPLPLTHNLDILTIQISLFMSKEDERQILEVVDQLDDQRNRREFQEKINHLIKPQFFYTDLEDMNYEQLITFMCNRLKSEGYVSNDFIEGVLQREEMSSTSFSYGFALPHTFHVAAKQSCLSVAILNKPMKWGEYDVRLVILLAVDQEDRKMLRVFFDWLNSVVSNSSKFVKILKIKNHKEFMEQMLENH